MSYWLTRCHSPTLLTKLNLQSVKLEFQFGIRMKLSTFSWWNEYENITMPKKPPQMWSGRRSYNLSVNVRFTLFTLWLKRGYISIFLTQGISFIPLIHLTVVAVWLLSYISAKCSPPGYVHSSLLVGRNKPIRLQTRACKHKYKNVRNQIGQQLLFNQNLWIPRYTASIHSDVGLVLSIGCYL